jgi:hypothetical protein
LLSPPLSRAFFAGHSISCSGGRGVSVSGPFCLQLFQVFTGAKANPDGVRTQTGANFESVAIFQAFHRLSLHIYFRADTLSCIHSWPGEFSRYSQWVVMVAAGGCKRLAASLQRTTSTNQQRLFY